MNIRSPFQTPIMQATSSLSAMPGFYPRGIAPIQRTMGVNGVLGDLFGDAGTAVEDAAAELLKVGIGSGVRAGKEAAGYQFAESVQVTVNGVAKVGVKAKRPDGAWVVVFSDGSETPWTSTLQESSRPISSTGTIGTAAGIGVGLLAVGALVAFLLLRKK